MSAGAPGRREVAHRLFAAEFDDSTFSYSESDEERAPNYVITPTGARVNRLFVVGVLTAVERVNDDVLRARVVDPTGAFVVYASQYQPEALAFLERTEPPAFVAVTGKANTFQPDGSDRTYTSVRPESVNVVDAETRDRWAVQTAAMTLERISRYADAVSDPESAAELPSGVELARDQYGTTPAYLAAMRDVALDAARVVAGEIDAVDSPTLAPNAASGGDVSFADLRAVSSIVEAATNDVPGVGAETPAEPAEAPVTPTPDTATAVDESASDAAESSASSTDDAATPAAGTEVATSVGAGTVGATDAVEETAETSGAGTVGESDDLDAGNAPDDSGTTEAPESPDVAESTDAAEAPVATGVPGDDGDESAASEEPTGGDDVLDFDEDVLDEEERAEVEETYGTEFTTGADVGDPGEAGIDVPTVDELEESLADEGEAPTDVDDTDSDAGTEPAADDAAADDAAADDAAADDASPADDVDLESVVVDAMRDLDDGDGAEREAVIETVVDEYRVESDAVEDAIQDALMGGRCYEPADDRLKPI